MNEIKRIRTIRQAIAEIRRNDPNTMITEGWLRSRCKENHEFCEKYKGIYLINMDLLYGYIASLWQR